MKPFWKVFFGACLGTLVAFILVNMIIFGIIGSALSGLGGGAEETVSVPKNAILRIDLQQPVSERGTESFSFNPL